MSTTMATQSLSAADVVQSHAVAPSLVSVTVPRSKVADILKNPAVESVQEEKIFKPFLQNSIPIINADWMHNNSFLGAGYAIAILDTGVDSRHPALNGKLINEACFSTNAAEKHATSLCPNGVNQVAPGTARPCPLSLSGCEHGTHVAGIAASATGTLNGNPISGVAPGSKIVAVQVFSRIDDPNFCGPGVQSCIGSFELDQIAALQYIWSISSNVKIAAVNISAGEPGTKHSNNCDDELSLKEKIDQLRSVNVLTVVAAGNEGYSDGIDVPACISSAISVGASVSNAGVATDFSDRAPFLTLVAPGTGIMSTWPVELGGGYKPLDGTSMAAPFVAGTIALLRAAHPEASANQIATALIAGTQMIVDSAPDASGNGHNQYHLLNAKIALDNLQQRGASGLVAAPDASGKVNSPHP